MGNCLFLHAQGWGIDRQVRTKSQIPGGMQLRDGPFYLLGGGGDGHYPTPISFAEEKICGQ